MYNNISKYIHKKDMTAVCFKKCFTTEKNKMDFPCFDLCYQKYKLVLRDTTHILKEIGYKLHSDIAYKAFPEENPFFTAFYGGIFVKASYD